MDAIFERTRTITSKANHLAFGGLDNRSGDIPGRVSVIVNPNTGETKSYQLLPSITTPTPHSFPNVAASTQYIGIASPDVPRGLRYPDGNFQLYNFAAVTASIPAADRQSFYGSFTREICDNYLTMFADFKYTRSLHDAAAAATGFSPDPFKKPTGDAF